MSNHPPAHYYGYGMAPDVPPITQRIKALEEQAIYNGKRLRWELTSIDVLRAWVTPGEMVDRGWQQDVEGDCLFRTRGF